jgi:carboxyl-terminal processing protease
VNRSFGWPIVLLLLTGFAVGVAVDRTGVLPGTPPRAPASLGHTFDPFWETWALVEKHYVDRAAVNPERMTRGAITGLLASLGDVGHTTYLTAGEAKELQRSLEGKLEGIGATVTIRNHQPTILQTVPGSPAQKAGLRAGDIIAQVDGKRVSELSLGQVVRMVRGKPGTTVHLQILRKGATKPLEFDITRANVKVPEVAWHLLPGTPIAHLALREFGKDAHDQLLEALKEMRKADVKGVIVDIRVNPGGLKDQAVKVTSEFLSGGNVFLEQDAKGHRTAVAVERGGQATDLPLCVLIDEGTASSAEIFAGALQDHDRAKLVGTKTFGTGTVLEGFKLSDDSVVLLAVREWFTPKGRQIWHKGIKPDVEVPLPEGASMLLPENETDLDAAALAKTQDKQLLRALELLQAQLKKGRPAAATPP